MKRGRQAARVTFNKNRTVLTGGKSPANIRVNMFETTMLSAVLFVSEMWSTTKSEEKMLAVTQKVAERRMYEVSVKDR